MIAKKVARVWVVAAGYGVRLSMCGDGDELPAGDARAAADAAVRAGNGWAREIEGFGHISFSQPKVDGRSPVAGGALRDALKSHAMVCRSAAKSELEARGYRVLVSRPL